MQPVLRDFHRNIYFGLPVLRRISIHVSPVIVPVTRRQALVLADLEPEKRCRTPSRMREALPIQPRAIEQQGHGIQNVARDDANPWSIRRNCPRNVRSRGPVLDLLTKARIAATCRSALLPPSSTGPAIAPSPPTSPAIPDAVYPRPRSRRHALHPESATRIPAHSRPAVPLPSQPTVDRKRFRPRPRG